MIKLASKVVAIRAKVNEKTSGGLFVPTMGHIEVTSNSGTVLAIADDVTKVSVGQYVVFKGSNRWMGKIVHNDMDGLVSIYNRAANGDIYAKEILDTISFENDPRAVKLQDHILLMLEEDIIAIVEEKS